MNLNISYLLIILALTLTILSSNTKKQEECKKALNEYVQKSVLVREHPKQEVLKRWTQPAINGFYRFCVDRHVMVDMDINLCYLKLSGSEKSVTDAEKEYYRERAEQSEQARLAAIARNIIWAYKINHNSWGKYSIELNARIEDAHLLKEPTVSHCTIKKHATVIIIIKSSETSMYMTNFQ
jgi:hypothetical protein